MWPTVSIIILFANEAVVSSAPSTCVVLRCVHRSRLLTYDLSDLSLIAFVRFEFPIAHLCPLRDNVVEPIRA